MFSGVSLETRSSKALFFSSGTAHYEATIRVASIKQGSTQAHYRNVSLRTI